MKKLRHTVIVAAAIFLGLAGYVGAQSSTTVTPLRLYNQSSVTPLPLRYKLNMTGPGVNCVDNASTLESVCTVTSGGGGGVSWPLTNGTSTNTYTSAVVDSSSAVAHQFDTAHAFTTAGDKLFSFSSDGAEQFEGQWNNSFSIFFIGGATGTSSSQIGFQSNNIWFSHAAGSLDAYMTAAAFTPFTNLGMTLGTPGSTYWSSASVGFLDVDQGSQITAASSITPTLGQHHITGATTINNIVATNFSGNARLSLIADTALSWSSSGNISVSGSLASGMMQEFSYDQGTSKWYPAQ